MRDTNMEMGEGDGERERWMEGEVEQIDTKQRHRDTKYGQGEAQGKKTKRGKKER